jgi:UDP-N-acetylmuramoyl-L-alanyl-D-glutamate--2,6-diaminopimelate ligase
MDDKYGLKLLKLINKNIKVITYSLRNKNADFYLKNNYKLNSKFLLEIENKRKTYFIKTSLFGEYNFQNILAAFSYSLTKGLNVEKIIKGIEAFRGAPGRLEKIKNNNLNIFIDYAHTPDALKKSLISLKENFNNKKLFVVFGCGGNRDKGKRKTMGAIAEEFADKVILTSDNPRFEDPLKIIEDILGGFKKKGEKAIIINRREAIRSSIKNLNYNCVLLIAGKGHENYQEIDGKRKTFSDLEEAKEALKEYAS